MAVAHDEVDVSRWEHAGEPPAVPVLRRALRHFAEDHGADPRGRGAVELALCEVVAHGVSAAAAGAGDGRITIGHA